MKSLNANNIFKISILYIYKSHFNSTNIQCHTFRFPHFLDMSNVLQQMKLNSEMKPFYTKVQQNGPKGKPTDLAEDVW